MVVGGCGWLWVVVGGCGWLWLVVGDCGSFLVLVSTLKTIPDKFFMKLMEIREQSYFMKYYSIQQRLIVS